MTQHKSTLIRTPQSLGYRWPAEWEPHRGTLLAWPHNQATWSGKFEPIVPIYCQIIEILSSSETVHINVPAGALFDQATELVGHYRNVILHEIATNDAWARDHGGTFLQSPAGKPPAVINWQYNAWGGKYPPWDDDNRVPKKLANRLGYDCFDSPTVLEGGAIEGNGQGLLMTTASCVLSESRNQAMNQAKLESIFHDYLGATKTIWLGGEIPGDDTDGHIDQLARFVSTQRVLVATERDKSAAHYQGLRRNIDLLNNQVELQDGELEVIELPLPTTKFYNGQALPCSYCNFYIANSLVLVPQFHDPADQYAVEIIKDCFPKREIVPLDSLDLSWGLGSFHCITQQIV